MKEVHMSHARGPIGFVPATAPSTSPRNGRVYSNTRLGDRAAPGPIFLHINLPHQGVLSDLARRLDITNVERVAAGRVAEVNAQRRIEMGAAGAQEARPGRGDTGVSVFAETFPRGVESLDLGSVIETLFGRGYRAVSATAITLEGRREQNEKDKFRIRVVFRSGDALEGTAPLERIERQLATFGYVGKFAHVWENPDGTTTVNLIGRDDSAHTVTELGFDKPSGRWFVDTEVATSRR